jgi:hypothetical protein
MVVRIELTDGELASIKQATNQSDAAAAVTQAAREFVRVNELKKLKLASGNFDFQNDWQGLELLEMGDFPVTDRPMETSDKRAPDVIIEVEQPSIFDLPRRGMTKDVLDVTSATIRFPDLLIDS